MSFSQSIIVFTLSVTTGMAVALGAAAEEEDLEVDRYMVVAEGVQRAG